MSEQPVSESSVSPPPSSSTSSTSPTSPSLPPPPPSLPASPTSSSRPPRRGLPMIVFIALIAGLGFVFLTLQQTQTNLESAKNTATLAARTNATAVAELQAQGTAVADAGTQVATAGTAVADVLATSESNLTQRRSELSRAQADITTLEAQGTTAGGQLATATAVFDQARTEVNQLEATATAEFNAGQGEIATLESRGTRAAGQLSTATAVFDANQQQIATLEQEGIVAEQQLATATAVFDQSVATIESQNTAATVVAITATAAYMENRAEIEVLEAEGTAARIDATADQQILEATQQFLDQTATAAQLSERDTLTEIQTTATQAAEDFGTAVAAQDSALSTLVAEGTAVAEQLATANAVIASGAGGGGSGSEGGTIIIPDVTEIAAVVDVLEVIAPASVNAAVAQADQFAVAYPELAIDLTERDNLSQREWYEGDYTDFAVGASIQWGEGAAEDECGFSFRDADDDNFYTVRVNQQGAGRFLVRVNGAWGDSQLFDASMLVTGGGSMNDLLVVGVGDQFTLAANGRIIASFSDTRLESGRLGLLAVTFDESETTGCTFINAWRWDLSGAAITLGEGADTDTDPDPPGSLGGSLGGGGGGNDGDDNDTAPDSNDNDDSSGNNAPTDPNAISASNANQLAEATIGGQGTVNSVSLAADGNLAVFAGGNGVYLYDVTDTGVAGEEPTLTYRTVLRGHHRAVYAAVISPDGQYVATAGDDFQVFLWDLATGAKIMAFQGHFNLVRALAFNADSTLLATGSWDGTTRVWNVPSGTLRHRFEVGENINALVFSAEEDILVAGDEDGNIYLWEMQRGREVGLLEGHRSAVNTLALFGSRLASGSDDNNLILWDLSEEAALFTLAGHGGNVQGVAFNMDGTRIVSVGGLGEVRWWNAETGEEIAQFNGSAGAPTVTSVTLHAATNSVIFTDTRNEVGVFSVVDEEIVTGRIYRTLFNGGLYDLVYSPHGQRIVTGGEDGRVAVWDAVRGTLLNQTEPQEERLNSIWSVAYSPNNEMIAAGFTGLVRIYNAATLDQSIEIAAGVENVGALAFSPDSRFIAGSVAGNLVTIWDVNTGEQIEQFTGHLSDITGLVFADAGDTLISSDAGGAIYFWDLVRGREDDVVFYGGGISDLTISPDGSLFAFGASDRTVQIWDVERKREVRTLSGDINNISHPQFSPDGLLIAAVTNDSLGGDTTVRVWDIDTGNTVAVLRGHTSTMEGVYFSPDGTKLASISRDGTLRLWTLNGAAAFPPDLESSLETVGLETASGYVGDQRDFDAVDLSGGDNIIRWTTFSGWYRDVVVKVDVQWGLGVREDECGIILRETFEGVYVVAISREGYVQVATYANEEWSYTGQVDADMLNTDADGTNTLMVVHTGNAMLIYINGELVQEYEDRSHTEGKVGLMAANFSRSDEAGCLFRDGWVWNLNEE